MISQRIRLPYLAGGMLLVASMIGATIVNNRPVEAGPQDETAKIRDSVGQGVVCIGRVDVEAGLVPLAPLQPGAIVEMYCYEGQAVKKGDRLLKVQEAPFRHKVAEAEEGVAVATALLAQARQGLERHPEIIAAQEAVIRAKQAQVASAEAQFARIERLMNLHIPQVSAEEVTAAKEGIKALKEAVIAEEAKLREIQKTKPDEKVAEAQKGIEVRKKQVDQAREALERCTLTAPQDGTIIQVQSTVGTQYGPQSHAPALILAPNGPRIVRLEVDQEFAGRIVLGANTNIQDETNVGPMWTGKIIRIADAYLPKRPSSSGPEIVATSNENRTLEVIVSIDPATAMPRLGQRMRASITGAASMAAAANKATS